MPLGQLRRKDREISAEAAEECLARTLVGRIGTVGADGMPYVIPMNFVYDPSRRTVFLHHTTSGHLLDNLAHSAKACFEVDEPAELVASGPLPCDMAHNFTSVICFGRARLATEGDEKEAALHLLARKYTYRLPGREYVARLATMDAIVVIALEVETLTGKRRS